MTHEFQVFDGEINIKDQAVNGLLGIKDDKGMAEWIKNNHSVTVSKSITDSENLISIEDFM